MNWAHCYWGILGVLGLVVWSLNFFNILKKPQLFLPSRGDLKNSRMKWVYLIFVLGVASWVFLTISIMGPRKVKGIAKRDVEVRDIFILVDVSLSMMANDFNPNRLEVSKNKIREFVKLRSYDRVGLIMFSEKVFTLLPLSMDHNILKKSIDLIKTGRLGSGTNIGDALALATARLNESPSKSKVIVLLTDGVSNVGLITPQQASSICKEQGIKVYTIGIGGNEDAKIPVGGIAFGGAQRYQTIPGGSIDLQSLKEIAELTGGKDFFAGDETALENVFQEIEKLEKTKVKSMGQTIYEELYYYYLIRGVFLFFLVEILKWLLLKEIV